MRRAIRIALKTAAWLTALLVILTIAAVVVLKSDWFHEKVRQRIVAELERATGGAASLGDFQFYWRRLTAEVSDLTLRGTEPADAAPLLHVKSVQAGLKIISVWRKDVDINWVMIKEPNINLILNEDGSTNIPAPKISSPGQRGLQPILDWKIGQFSIENGAVRVNGQKSGLNARGENLHARFSYDISGPRYKGQVLIAPLEIKALNRPPEKLNLDLALGLEKNRIEVSSAKLDLRRSHIEAAGSIEDLSSPKAAFRFTARMAAAEGGELLKIEGVKQGTVDLAGSAKYNSDSDYTVSAGANLRGVEFQDSGIHVSGVRGTCLARLSPRGLELDSIALQTMGGRFTGRASLPKLQRIVADGSVQDIQIQQALAAFVPELTETERTIWSGAASGPVRIESRLTGVFGTAMANVAIEPAPGGIPVRGMADARYDGQGKTLTLGKSHLEVPGANLDVSGVLNEKLDVRAVSNNLDDLLPAINALSSSPVKSLPVQLKNGSATFEGTVTGKLKSPHIAGSAALTSFALSGIHFDRFAGQVSIDESSAHVENAALARGAAQAQIAATIGLSNWKPEPANPITGTATLRNADVAELLELAGEKQIQVRGGLVVSGRVSGTVGAPQAAADVTVTKGVAYDEPFDRLQASVDYSPQAIHVRQVTLAAGPAQITGEVSFEPVRAFSGAPEFRNGQVQFKWVSNDVALDRFQFMKRLRPDLTGIVRANLEGAVTLREGAPASPPQALITSLSGSATARDLSLDGRSISQVKATAQTQASVLQVKLDSTFLNSKVTAAGEWRLGANYPGEATVRFTPISLAAVRGWLSKSGAAEGLNFDGVVEGDISFAGPAVEPREWKASARFPKLEVYPLEQGRQTGAGRFTLRNEGPVVLTMAKSVIGISSAHFTGPSSDISVTGTASIDPRVALDLRVNGGVDLAILQSLAADIETAGAVTVNAAIRGTPDRPSVNGRLVVKGGSLHLADITTGLSAANGTILFSGTQATLQDFTGAVGGGKISLSGVVGFTGGELSYRVDANAKDVRVRYPEGVSTSADAELSLHGTSERSTLSGLVTVLRTGFTPRTDFSSILGKAAEPVRTPSARTGPLGGMRFDVRVETAPDISFESSLAQDIQVEGNLRLQGTPYNPVLLGRLNVTQGEINFFGTKYTINQGSVTFANPVKLEPVLNVDLETRVQGIDVTLTISGPINKLNITPRSDPPMSYSDVLALLATGSAPSSDPTLQARQNAPQQSFTQLGASALIGQVVANPVSNRLQRFFGVSSLKINPRISGVENNPQARVTLEQQVSKDVTFTYITNIASTNQVIVRIEWALNKNWSAIAVRDENGLFGLDFLYKKRFK
jgi:translocation and assembly module TamB